MRELSVKMRVRVRACVCVLHTTGVVWRSKLNQLISKERGAVGRGCVCVRVFVIECRPCLVCAAILYLPRKCCKRFNRVKEIFICC